MSKNLKSVITCDLDGKIETFSSGAQDMFGYTEEEIIGKGRVSDFSAGQIVLGHVVNWLAESVEKGAWEGNTVFLHKDGHEMPCKIKITPTKPIKTAIHLNIPTFSLNKKIDNIVINKGAA